MTVRELKQLRLHRQHLTAKTDMLTVVRDLAGIQAQITSNVYHSLKLRASDYDAAAVTERLVKNWTVRGTVHAFAPDELALFMHCKDGRAYRSREFSGYRVWNDREKWALSPERQRFFSELVLSSLSGGALTRDELKSICSDAGMTELESAAMFDPWGGGIRVLCERGFMHHVVSEKKAFALSPEFTPIPEEQAELELLRRYLTHMAPATSATT